MSVNTKSTKKPMTEQAWFKVTFWISIIIIISVALWFLRNLAVDEKINQREQQISKVVINSIKHHLENDILIPETYVISFDTITKSQINDSLKTYLKDVLLNKYIRNDTSNGENPIKTPYFIFPTNKNHDGTYKITEKQLSELKENIIYITNQVDEAVSEVKSEIANDIMRVNNWITLWIGVIGFLGIFIPILLNFLTTKNIDKELAGAITKADKAEEKIDAAKPTLNKVEGLESKVNDIKSNISAALIGSEKAKEQVDSAKKDIEVASKDAREAKQKIKDAEPLLNKVDEIEGKTKNLEMSVSKSLEDFKTARSDAEQAKKDADIALTSSKKALTTSKKLDNLLMTSNSISKLKSIDAYRLIYIQDKKAYLVKVLEGVNCCMQNCDESFDHNIIKDSFQELVVSLYSISKFDFIDHQSIDSITQFVISVNGSIENDWNREKFKSNMSNLEDLIQNLKN